MSQEKNRVALSIVIVNYNSGKMLRSCLRSIDHKLSGVSVEVIVVDNASVDGSAEMLDREYPHVKLIREPENLGFAKGVNDGVKEARGRYVLLLNPDVVFANRSMDAWLAFMDDHPQVGIAGPKVYDDETKRSVQLSCRGFPSPMNYLFSRYSPLTKLFPNNPYAQRFLMSDWTHDSVRMVDWVSGCCMLVRAEMLRDLGVLDTSYPLFFEDVDLCYRARKADWMVAYFPGMEVIHFTGSVRVQAPFRTILDRHQSLWRFYRKFYSRGIVLNAVFFLGIFHRMLALIVLAAIKRSSPVLIDVGLIQVAFLLAYLTRSLVEFPWFERAVGSYPPVAPWYTLLQVFLLYAWGLYGRPRVRYHDYLDVLPRVLKAVSLGTVMLVFIAFFGRQFFLPRSIVLLSWLYKVLLLTGWRWVALRLTERRRPLRRALIYGTGELAELVRDELVRRPSLNVLPMGFVRPEGDGPSGGVGPVMGGPEDLPRIIETERVDKLIFAPDACSSDELARVLHQCEEVFVDTEIAADLFEVTTGRIYLEHFSIPFIEPIMLPGRGWYFGAKRLFDVLVSSVLVVTLAPLGGLLALCVKLSSPGPVFFRQPRVGQHGREFVLHKFRTMRHEPNLDWKLQDEDLQRFTPFGRFLRLTRLDELPQLVNVLRGEMSLVGPRAEWTPLARQMEREIPHFEQRYAVRPGMTGWAQVEYKYTTSVEEYRRKMQYDLYYVKHMSFSLDLAILVKTLWVVITGSGAR